jgi:magnesium transporter
VIVDCAHYKDGARQHEGPLPLDEVAERRGDDGFVWLGLHDPDPDELREVAEVSVFGERSDETRRIYFLRRELAEFYRAVHPLLPPLDLLMSAEHPEISSRLREHLRDVTDHVKRIEEAISTQRELLTSILQANLAVISVQQNDVVKQISGWAAIITVPTLIASVYGMNFEHMPELQWHYGYPACLLVMAIAGVVLHRVLRRAGWL